MNYLDNGATSFPKPSCVGEAMRCAMDNCANPGRGGYRASMNAASVLLQCRQRAAALFDCAPEQVIHTTSCTHGLNIAIGTLVKPGQRVVISGFEHNAVTRPLYALGAQTVVAGRKLFDPEDTLQHFEDALKQGAQAAVFTHMSNVFGYILPVEEMAALCRQYGIPFVVDAAQSAGSLPVKLGQWGAAFIAMPGHKGLLGPMGTGLLLCREGGKPLIMGGTGSWSARPQMPDFLPDALEAGTLNVPGIAGLSAGLHTVAQQGIEAIFARERREAERCGKELEKLGFHPYCGKNQGGTVSFTSQYDCEQIAAFLSDRNVCVRAGLHCAPLAHESAGTLQTGTVRVSFGHNASPGQTGELLQILRQFLENQRKHPQDTRG